MRVLKIISGVQYLNNQNYKTCIKSERNACFMQLTADSNHFMLEPVEAEDMSAEMRKKRRQEAVNDAMGMSLLFPRPPRRRKLYGRPNAKAGDMYCAADYLMIPGGQDMMETSKMSHSHDRFCGGFLNSENDAEQGASVYSRHRCIFLHEIRILSMLLFLFNQGNFSSSKVSMFVKILNFAEKNI